MEGLFSKTPFNQPIGNWNVSHVTDMSNMFTISNLGNRRAVAVISVFLLGFLFVLGAEVLIREPDLRTNGMHGILAQSPGVHGPTGDSIRPG